MWERVRKLRITRRTLKHLEIAAIGPATKKAIVKHGLKVKICLLYTSAFCTFCRNAL